MNINPLTPTFGATVTEIDLSVPITEGQRDALREALNRYKLLHFDEQDITQDQHVAFAANFGELERYPVQFDDNLPEISVFEPEYGRSDMWHTDGSWRERPALASILRCLAVPEAGGDTAWLDMVGAYAALPQDLKDEIDDLYAVHDSFNILRNMATDSPEFETRKSRIMALRQDNPLVAHPIVRRHADTGEEMLYLNPALMSGIVGMTNEAAMDLFDRIYSHVLQPQYSLRMHWRPNRIAMWDQRSTLHYGVMDHGDAYRRLERVLVAGTEVPCR